MAGISTSINLYDRVTAPINNIISAINSVCNAFDSVEQSMDGGFNADAIESARAALSAAVGEADKLGDEIAKSVQKQNEFTNEVEESASKMGLLKTLASGIGLYFGLSEAKQQIGSAISYASDLQEVQNVVDTAFKGSEDVVNKWASTTLESFGLNELSAKKFAGTMGAMLKSSGMSGDAVGEMSMRITELAGDMASFYNLEGEEAFNKIRSGISGETEPLKQLGINMSVANLEAFALSQGIKESYNEMTQAEQVTLRYNYLLKATADAQGDFADTSNSFANQQKLLSENWRAFTGELANNFLPTLTMGLMALNNSVKFLSENWAILSPLIAGVVGILGVYLAVTKGVVLWHTIQTAVMTGFKAIQTFVSIGWGVLTGNTAAASAAQFVYNSALLACPLTWIIILLIAVIAIIFAVIGVINKLTGSTVSATGVIVGALLTAVAFIWNLFLGLLDFVLGIINALVNPWIAWINFFGNLFNDPIGSIIHLFGDWADNTLSMVESVAKALDKLMGTNLAGSVQNWRNGLNELVDKAAEKYGNGSYEAIVDGLNLSSDSLGLKRWEYGDAYNTGYAWGEKIEDGIGNVFDDVLNNSETLTDIAGNTEGIADTLGDTEEELAYLRDIAERDTINRFTTAQITVEQTNNNNINSTMDIDGIMGKWNDDFTEILETAAEGVH